MNCRSTTGFLFRITFLCLTGVAALVATPSEAIGAPLRVKEIWRRTALGSQIGASGLTVADLDGDGRPEILVGGNSRFDHSLNDFWQILRWDGTNYSQIWESLPEGTLRVLTAFQADTDRALEILTTSRNEIRLYDGATRKIERRILTPASEIRSLAVADLDGDGKVELIFCDPIDLFVANLATGTLLWRLPGFGGSSLAVGQLDDDAAQEIVVTGFGEIGRVIDGMTRQVEWPHPAGFGFSVRLADLTGDSRLEIIALVPAGVRVFDPRRRTQLWKRLTNDGATAIAVGDIDGDGRNEVVYGDFYRGLRVLDGRSGAGRWLLDSESISGTSAVAIGDPDNDGKTEILWALNSRLTTVDVSRRQIDWSDLGFSGPIHGFDFGDVDADGRREFLYTGYGADTNWFVHDARNFRPEFQGESVTDYFPYGFIRLVSANVDSDPQREIFLTGGQSSGLGNFGALIAYDGKTHTQEWRYDLTDSGAFQALAIADVDRDGHLEVVASTGGEIDNRGGQIVYVFDAATGNLEWRSPPLSSELYGYLYPLRIAQIDDDPQPEIVVRGVQGSILVLDAVKRIVEMQTQPLGVAAFDVHDLDGDGKSEIVVASGGKLAVVDLSTSRLGVPLASYPDFISSLRVLDLNGDGKADFLLTSDYRVRAIDGASKVEVWRSPKLGYFVGSVDSLFPGDFDGDGQLEFAVSAGLYGLILYEIQR